MTARAPRLTLVGLWIGVLLLPLVAHGETSGTCDRVDSSLQTGLTEELGLAHLTVSGQADRRGKFVWVDYAPDGDDVQASYAVQFDDAGKAQLNFALTGDTNDLTIRPQEASTEHCRVAFSDRDKVYRAVMRWRDPVRFNLHVIEPFRRFGEYGHVRASGLSSMMATGLGRIDVVLDPITDPSGDISSGEQSYMVPASSLPPKGIFTFRAEYASRGATPTGDFCGSGKFADVEYTLTLLEPGKPVRSQTFSTGRMPCGVTLQQDVQFLRLNIR